MFGAGGAAAQQGAAGAGGGAPDVEEMIAIFNSDAWAIYRGGEWVTSGTDITEWTDRSGNGRHATGSQGTGSTYPQVSTLGGNAAARFDDHAQFSLPDMSGFTEGELFAVLAVDTTNGGNSIGDFGTQAATHWYAHTGGAPRPVFDTFGLATPRFDWSPSTPITNRHAYNVHTTTGEWEARLNGVVQKTRTTGTVGFPASPILGYNDAAGDEAVLNGEIELVVILDRLATGTERSDFLTAVGL